ncbi:MAG: urease accessory protein UreE [Alphaproteobacteria bacterium]
MSLRRAIDVAAAGTWPAADAVATVTLDFDDRYRRRVRLVDDAGEAFLLDLDDATRLADGDGLKLEGGGIVAVRSADEQVLDIRCADPRDTARMAWHIGNRHLPTQVLEDGALRIRADHVIEAMLIRLGAEVEAKTASFNPEPGAYDTGEHGHHHDH